MCALCDRKYRNIKSLLDHDQLMHSKMVNYCEICFEVHKSRNDLYEHYKQVHLKVTSSCNDSFFVQHSIEDGAPNFNASFASTSSESSNEDLIKNTSIFINTSGSTIDTTINSSKKNSVSCAKTSQIASANFEKKDLVRGLIDSKYQCKWCLLRFYTKTQLKNHEATHINTTLYCPVCDKEFLHKDRLAGHMKCHMEPSLECKICGKKFKRLCNLYNHELVHGLTEHAFMLCQFCGRGFRSRRDYQNHVIANHRDQLMKADSTNSQLVWTKANPLNESSVNKKDKINQRNKRKIKASESKKQLSSHQFETEADTYFTRTDTTIHSYVDHGHLCNDDFNDADLDEDQDGDELNANFNSSYNNTEKFSDRIKNKSRNYLNNKFKRLKTSLNIEVIEDDENVSLNDFNHILGNDNLIGFQNNQESHIHNKFI